MNEKEEIGKSWSEFSSLKTSILFLQGDCRDYNL